jgi:hypothetical protein
MNPIVCRNTNRLERLFSEGSIMNRFSTEDVKVYRTWLRRTAAIYAGLVVLAAAAVTTLAVTGAPTSATYLAAAVSLSSP